MGVKPFLFDLINLPGQRVWGKWLWENDLT